MDFEEFTLVQDIQVIPSFRENLLEPKIELDIGPLDTDNLSTFNVLKQFKQMFVNLPLGFECKATMTRVMDRPTNDEYFFNVPIEDWIDLSIENMLEIKV
jgi:hypothetical protein